jgi:hydrogenase expression/formation protein HypC
MCIAIPARVLDVNAERARVESAQQPMEVGRALIPELDVGDWVLVNTGQIVSRLTPEEAEATRELIFALKSFEIET